MTRSIKNLSKRLKTFKTVIERQHHRWILVNAVERLSFIVRKVPSIKFESLEKDKFKLKSPWDERKIFPVGYDDPAFYRLRFIEIELMAASKRIGFFSLLKMLNLPENQKMLYNFINRHLLLRFIDRFNILISIEIHR